MIIIIIGNSIHVTKTSGYLRDTVLASAGALGLILRPELQPLLLLLKVHQVPLILQPGLPSLPELQEQSH